MSHERHSALNLLITRHHDIALPREVGFWEEQLASPENTGEWWKLAYGVSLSKLSKKEDAEDNAQETMIHIQKSGNTFRGGNPSAWLIRVATNVGNDLTRKRSRRPQTSLEVLQDTQGFDSASNDPLDDPERSAECTEAATAIRTEFNKLSRRRQQIVYLCDIEGKDYHEAAEQLGVPIGTIKSNLSRARISLRQGLTARGVR